MTDDINHPSHYADGWSNSAEVIDITENLNFNRGNAVKYLARAGRKNPDAELEDLFKAQWYVNREIKRVEAVKADRAQRFAGVEAAYSEPLPDGALESDAALADLRAKLAGEPRTWASLNDIPVDVVVRDNEGDLWKRDDSGTCSYAFNFDVDKWYTSDETTDQNNRDFGHFTEVIA